MDSPNEPLSWPQDRIFAEQAGQPVERSAFLTARLTVRRATSTCREVTRSWDRPDEFMSPYTEGVIRMRCELALSGDGVPGYDGGAQDETTRISESASRAPAASCPIRSPRHASSFAPYERGWQCAARAGGALEVGRGGNCRCSRQPHAGSSQSHDDVATVVSSHPLGAYQWTVLPRPVAPATAASGRIHSIVGHQRYQAHHASGRLQHTRRRASQCNCGGLERHRRRVPALLRALQLL